MFKNKGNLSRNPNQNGTFNQAKAEHQEWAPAVEE